MSSRKNSPRKGDSICVFVNDDNVRCSINKSILGGDYCRFHAARRAQNAELDIKKELAKINPNIANALILNSNQEIDSRVQKLLIVNNHMPEQRTKEWYQYRKQIMTASPAAAYVLVSDYEYDMYKKGLTCLDGTGKRILPRHVDNRRCNCFGSWAEQVRLKCLPDDQQKPWSGNKYTRHGVKYEDVIKNIYEVHYGTSVLEFGIMPHPTIDWIGASPDGITVNGVMVEIKALSRKNMTPSPILQYWMQMQLQMEVCDLNECDFVEARIIEYDSKEEYLADEFHDTEGNLEYYLTADELPKGVVIAIEKDFDDWDTIQREFVYPPALKFESQEEEEEWIAQWIANKAAEGIDLFFDKTIRFTISYYKVVAWEVHSIKRDREWFKRRLPDFQKAWDTILEYRKNGIPEEFMPKEKPKITTKPSDYWFSPGSDSEDENEPVKPIKASKPTIPMLDLSVGDDNRKTENDSVYETDVF